jgi:peroxiredoxin Q/BCP
LVVKSGVEAGAKWEVRAMASKAKKAAKRPAKAKSKKPAKAKAKTKKPVAKKSAAKKLVAQKRVAKKPVVKAAAPRSVAKSVVKTVGPAAGTMAPEFNMPTDAGGSIALSELRGRAVILYFYPRDDTPGCTVEACAFRDFLPHFTRANAAILGVSIDTAKSHDRFKAKYGLPFPLISDEEHKLAESYGVWVEKNRYGRKYMGTERATFLIDADGKIAKVWRKVKVEGHAEEVLAAAKGI